MPFMGFFIVLPIVGAVVLFCGWQARRRHSLLPLVPALIAIALPGLLLWLVYTQDKYNSNPIVAPSELVGTWSHGSDSVTLTAEGDYRATSWPGGKWSFASDFEVLIGNHRWRMLRGPDGLVLCASCEGDPDDWKWTKVIWTRKQ